MLNLPEHAYSVLDREYHEPLIRDIESVARSAGIPKAFLWTSMTEGCSQAEIDYVTKLRTVASERGKYGIAYVGEPKGAPVHNRMMLVAAAAIRNYINARVLTLRALVNFIKDDDVPTPTVMCIPDFCMGKIEGGRVPEWVVHGLLSLLYERQAAESQTLVYLSSWDSLDAEYGSAFTSHIKENFLKLEF